MEKKFSIWQKFYLCFKATNYIKSEHFLNSLSTGVHPFVLGSHHNTLLVGPGFRNFKTNRKLLSREKDKHEERDPPNDVKLKLLRPESLSFLQSICSAEAEDANFSAAPSYAAVLGRMGLLLKTNETRRNFDNLNNFN